MKHFLFTFRFQIITILSLTADYIDYKHRHLFIQGLINIDFPGFRRLAHIMPGLLIPKPKGPLHLMLPTDLIIWIDPLLDQGVERSLYYTGTYEMGTLDIIERYLPEDGVFIDVGANIGLMSLVAALRIGENGQVIAFEPSRKTREIANHNIEINNLEDKITLMSSALGAKKEKKLLFDNLDINRGAASLVKGKESGEGEEIEITTLDSDYSQQKIDVLKIDVEGYELEVLKGAVEILRRKKPPVLIVECTEETEHQDFSRADLFDFILSTQPRYKCYKLKGTKLRRSNLIEIHQESDLPTHDNIICIPSAI